MSTSGCYLICIVLLIKFGNPARKFVYFGSYCLKFKTPAAIQKYLVGYFLNAESKTLNYGATTFEREKCSSWSFTTYSNAQCIPALFC